MSASSLSSPYIVDVSAETFDQAVLQASFQVPVVLDFWAEWCGPCRSLGPILEKLAIEYNGRFILAKLDSDQNQELAAQYRIRGIPAVKGVVNGEVVNEFTGAQPESAVRQFIESLLPSPAEPVYQQAVAAIVAGENEQALALLSQTLRLDPRHESAGLDQAELLLEMARIEDAEATLSGLTEVKDQERLASIHARLQLARTAAGGGDAAQWQARIDADPADLEARLELAKLLALQQDFVPAMEQLLEIVRRDRQFQEDAGRKTLINLFNVLGSDHPLVRQYRSRLASLLNV